MFGMWQARPRRRSGEICGAQDLTKGPNSPETEAAENLSIKKNNNNLPLNRVAFSPSPSSVNNVSIHHISQIWFSISLRVICFNFVTKKKKQQPYKGDVFSASSLSGYNISTHYRVSFW